MEPRNFASGAAGTPPTAPVSPSVGYATAGNPGTGTPATRPGAFWYHKMGESLRNLIVSAGLTPNDADLTQVTQAVQALVVGGANSIEFTSTATPTLNLTGVPPWANRITVLIENIASTTASINLLARLIGTTTPSTAYLSWGTRTREFSATVDTVSLTSGFLVKMSNDAAGGISGKLVFEKYRPGTNRWIYTGNVYGGGDSSNNHAVGRNTNDPGPVTGIQLLPASGNWTAGGKVLLTWD